ncbi:HDOD domain-containing protein [Tissierella sp. Yu-01]|uniref:HDOD domain-containing protein n=1 Tax=Tissierella sp. Yu-01 TaxID=3035694 RepID=UPI00240DC628|nr:HDOD domain-containing protein [Tissierella sp. Yu-01]WFA07616.1 HDOD domain-containing protein [Tissierella sp. Yu-01]
MDNHYIIELIEGSSYLPKISSTFGDILTMLLEPYEFNMDECIEKISNHPGLEKSLVRVLNYNSNLNRVISNLKDAVVYLGAKTTKIVAISYITRLLLPDKIGRAKIFNNKVYWKHCVGTSIASYMIAEETNLCDKDKMFTYGLIHDIGITVLDICLPDYIDKIYSLQLKGIHQIAAEKIVLSGLTHSEIGMWLCKNWGLPDEIVDIVGYHHSPFKNSSVSNEVKIIHLADSISTKYYEKLLGNERTFIYSEKIRESLNLSANYIEDIGKVLPKEVDKVMDIINF